MSRPDLATIDGRMILACFTQARRMHEGLTRSALARLLGIRTDQVKAAEAGHACGRDARDRLLQWNGLCPCDGSRMAAPLSHVERSEAQDNGAMKNAGD